ncbi:MAG: PAS domain-containing protein [Pseudomonadota bacterium]
MTEFIGFNALVLFGSGVSAAIMALLAATWLSSRRDDHERALFGRDRMDDGIAFLLHGRDVIDASAEGWRILDADDGAQSRWQRLSVWLDRTFPDGSDRVLATGPKTPRQIVDGKSTPARRLLSRDIYGLTLVRVEPIAATSPVTVDHEVWRANEVEMADLRELAAKMPVAAWRTDHEGRITWINAAYLELLPQGSADIRPVPAVFPRTENDGTGRQRQCLRNADGTERWFDHYIHPTDTSVLHFALPAIPHQAR